MNSSQLSVVVSFKKCRSVSLQSGLFLSEARSPGLSTDPELIVIEFHMALVEWKMDIAFGPIAAFQLGYSNKDGLLGHQSWKMTSGESLRLVGWVSIGEVLYLQHGNSTSESLSS